MHERSVNYRLLWGIVVLLSLAGLLAATGLAAADRTTPFVEGLHRIGDRSKERGYVVSLGDKELTKFLVIVTTDTMEFVTILATAEPRVVKPDLLGRPVIIDGEIATRQVGRDGRVRVTLKIHGVEPPPK